MQKSDVLFSRNHPKSMYFLALVESCHRFIFWGIAYLLPMYISMKTSRTFLESCHYFGLYIGSASLLNIAGNWLSSYWNKTTMIFAGILISSTGAFLLATNHSILIIPSLCLLVIGNGLIIPNSYTLLGAIYTKESHSRAGGLSIYYAISQIGTLLGLILLSSLYIASPSLAFICAGIIQLLSLIPYTICLKTFEHKNASEQPTHTSPFPLKKQEKDRFYVLLIIIGISTVFWIGYSQIGTSILLFTKTYTILQTLTHTTPQYILAVYPLWIILGSLPLTALYLFLQRTHSSASPHMKTALGLFFMGLSFIVMQRACAHIPYHSTTNLISLSYPIISLILLATGELFLIPVGLSLLIHISHYQHQRLLISAWFGSVAIGRYLGSLLATTLTMTTLASFFDMLAIFAFVPACLLVLFSKKLDTMRHTM